MPTWAVTPRVAQPCNGRANSSLWSPSITPFPRRSRSWAAILLQQTKQFAKQAIVIDPEFWVGHLQLGQTCEQLGEHDEALRALNTAARLSNGNSKSMSLRGYLFANLGRIDEAREALKMLQTLSSVRFVPPYALALIHASLGEKDSAFDHLQHALDARDVHLTFLPVDPK
jgi:Flp pilus assembly protein TadD